MLIEDVAYRHVAKVLLVMLALIQYDLPVVISLRKIRRRIEDTCLRGRGVAEETQEKENGGGSQ